MLSRSISPQKITRAIILSSIIQIIGLLVAIFISNSQSRLFYSIVNENYKAQSECLNMVNECYSAEAVLLAYAESPDKSYAKNINDISESIKKSENNLKNSALYQKESAKAEGLIQNIYPTLKQFEMQISRMEKILDISEYIQLCNQLSNQVALINVKITADIEEKEAHLESSLFIQRFIFTVIILLSILVSYHCYIFVGKNSFLIFEQKRKAEENARKNKEQAYQDQLTKLWNRAYISQVVEKYLKKGGEGCLFEMDMDNFKSVNDTYGHQAGDEALKAMAKGLKNAVRDSDICCRAGGDEYMVFCKHIKTEEEANNIARKIREKTAAEFRNIEGGSILTLSMGCAISSDVASSYDTLYKQADIALYHVKTHGKNNFTIFMPKLDK